MSVIDGKKKGMNESPLTSSYKDFYIWRDSIKKASDEQLDVNAKRIREEIDRCMEQRQKLKESIDKITEECRRVGMEIYSKNDLLRDISKERAQRQDPKIQEARKKREENRRRPIFLLEMESKGVSLKTVAGVLGITDTTARRLLKNAKRLRELGRI